MMTASDSGVSTTRFPPKRSSSPSVARKTPPLRATSWPKTSTRPSRSISWWSVWLIDSTSVITAMAQAPGGDAGSSSPSRARSSARWVTMRGVGSA